MKQLLMLSFTIAIIQLLAGCNKEDQQFDESLFEGTWVKGPYTAGTLWFKKENNLNVLSYNSSFNAGLPVVAQMEYNYKNGKLELRGSYANDQTFYPVQSFTWIEQGKEFEIRAIELFSFISSTNSKFSYKKLN